MNNPQTAADELERVFRQIHHEQMAGIPILNDAMKVQALGFREYQGRIIGVLITPWMMSLVMLPGEDDDWSGLELGKKQPHKFPSKTLKFMVNEFDGIGKCQTHSLYSPMRDFATQEHALAAARGFLETLIIDTVHPDEDPVDEELLGRIMRGEETSEADPGDYTSAGTTGIAVGPGGGRPEISVRVEKKMSRRDLLRGS
ncbi:MAG: [NiFe]-hydrogenase assembly chaperone HybE, partial [Pseudomonadota bacterium]|nr:[NiFe]-hydrogenase assembly chaperone HybE [Pseudomonadota bacterium]